MYIILAPKTTALKTKSGFERLLIYISKYMLIIMHIILKWQSTSKVFKNEWKLITLVWGWVNYYKQVTEKLIYSDKNKPKQTKLASKCIFSEIKKTLVLSHFKIMCIIINIYFDLLIKRRSNPLLVLSVFTFRANIMDNGYREDRCLCIHLNETFFYYIKLE